MYKVNHMYGAAGTSFHGHKIDASQSELVAMLGKPDQNGEYKLRPENSERTINIYPSETGLDTGVFRIGAVSAEDSQAFFDWISAKLEKTREFNGRIEGKRERYEELAEKNRERSTQAYKESRQISDFIPPGQPILVGHHSEGRHRKDLQRIDDKMRKSVEADAKADYYENKSKSVGTSGISSDDPNAVQKLENKLQKLVEMQELMRAINKIVRNKKLSDEEKKEKISELMPNTKPETISEIVNPSQHWQSPGFPPYKLSNNNANINRIKKRIASLQQKESRIEQHGSFSLIVEHEKEGTVRIEENADANRLQVFFNGKPSDEIRSQLKRNGFRWSPKYGAWQSYVKQLQINRIKEILGVKAEQLEEFKSEKQKRKEAMDKELSELQSKYGAFFAFGKEQFEKASKKDVKYTHIAHGLYCPSDTAKEFWKAYRDTIRKYK